MYRLLVVLLTLSLASLAFGADVGNRLNLEKDSSHVGMNPGTPVERDGGETIETAVVIPALPFSDTGNTCGAIHNYDEACPYTGSTAPDEVYSYAPGMDIFANIDLCGSGYDTKVFVYQDAWTPGNPWACNDDFYSGPPCGTYVSFLENVPMYAGHTYYIVIDGWSGDCGNYILEVTEYEPCIIDCWVDAVDEGEPPLVDGYDDNYNGGCNSTPPVFQTINWANEDGGAWLCGVSGWYYSGGSFRDTDWFPVVADGYQIDWFIDAEFAVNCFVIIPNYSCPGSYTIPYSFSAGPCFEVSLSFATNPGEEFWLWVGPTVFSGPVNEFTYFMRVYGIVADVIPTEQTTLGTLKNLYK